MRALVKALMSSVLLGFLSTHSLLSQCEVHPEDPDALLHGTLGVHVVVDDICIVSCDVCAWRTSTGRLDLLINHNSIYLRNNCGMIDSMQSAEIFDRIDRESISAAIRMQYLLCGKSCDKPQSVRIYRAACVRRSESGADTKFISCLDGIYSTYNYQYCCPQDGDPASTFTLTSVEGGVCEPADGCERNHR